MTSPARSTIPIAKPLLGDAEAVAAGRAIRSGWVTQGPEVAAFERELAARLGAPHACAVSSCTTALHLALLAVGVRPGDEVVTVSHSFIATANAVRYCGAVPVFADIDPRTYNVAPDSVAAAVTPATKALLVVHQMGMPCDLATLVAFARERGLPLIEDAACAIGSAVDWNGRWEPIGRPHGDIACFSFHPRKVITTGDGGMLTTANPDWDAEFRLLRQHAMSVPDTVRHGSTNAALEPSYATVGYNYRLTDIQAAIGRAQLERLDAIIARRRALAGRYRELLGASERLALPHEPEWARSNWQSYCVRLQQGPGQAAVMQRMREAGVATRRGIMCAHREAAYAGVARHVALDESERAQDECVLLPLYVPMSDDDQDRVTAALLAAVA